MSEELVRNLARPECYRHPVKAVEMVETHISWVLLTGEFAYKIKKPVDFGFADFSTLERRRSCCEEELRLNRRTAPDLYLEVVAITGSEDRPVVGGDGEPIEYAVRMVQFDRAAEADRLLDAGHLDEALIDRLAVDVAVFHDRAAVASEWTGRGAPQAVAEHVLDNFRLLRECSSLLAGDTLERLHAWTRERLYSLAARLGRRLTDGHVRECHGDMHLRNMVLRGGRLVPFDCIEFNDELRWIDVMSELAFTVMDLDYRGRGDLGSRFLNRYLERGGDYDGLDVLRLYLVYRALVRAKVSCLRHAQDRAPHDAESLRVHVALAERYASSSAALILTHGLSGSGKTWLTDRLLARRGAVRVRSDVERKRLHGLAATDDSRSRPGGGLYSATGSAATYDRLAEVAARGLDAGFEIIVDATFLERSRRQAFRALARRRGAPFAILSLEAPRTVLEARIRMRQAGHGDASEADIAVLDWQMTQREPFAADESTDVVSVDAGADIDFAELDRRLSARLARAADRPDDLAPSA